MHYDPKTQQLVFVTGEENMRSPASPLPGDGFHKGVRFRLKAIIHCNGCDRSTCDGKGACDVVDSCWIVPRCLPGRKPPVTKLLAICLDSTLIGPRLITVRHDATIGGNGS